MNLCFLRQGTVFSIQLDWALLWTFALVWLKFLDFADYDSAGIWEQTIANEYHFFNGGVAF